MLWVTASFNSLALMDCILELLQDTIVKQLMGFDLISLNIWSELTCLMVNIGKRAILTIPVPFQTLLSGHC